MRVALGGFVHTVALLAVVACFYGVAWLTALLTDDSGGANLGIGLVAFLALMTVSLVWAAFDGSRLPWLTALLTWAVTAVLTAAAWVVWIAVSEDLSLAPGELLRRDGGTLVFDVSLVLAPAALGVLVGTAMRAARRPLPR